MYSRSMSKPISELLNEIKTETGWSEPRIATELRALLPDSRMSQPTVNRILNGQDECKSSTLRAIEALHERVCAAAVAKVNAPENRA
jgi:hypothetical protein